MSTRETARGSAGLVLVLWGVALFCLAALDWVGYQRFFVDLIYGGRIP